jgi:hypothetical protein
MKSGSYTTTADDLHSAKALPKAKVASKEG